MAGIPYGPDLEKSIHSTVRTALAAREQSWRAQLDELHRRVEALRNWRASEAEDAAIEVARKMLAEGDAL